MEPIGQLVRNFTSPQWRGHKAIVLDDDLFSAEGLVTALSACGITARFALPVTPAHLRDAVQWGPELALLNIDYLDDANITELVGILEATEVDMVALTAQPGEPTACRLRDAGIVVVDTALLAHDPVTALRDLLGHAELDAAPAFSHVEWAAEVA